MNNNLDNLLEDLDEAIELIQKIVKDSSQFVQLSKQREILNYSIGLKRFKQQLSNG
jgi:hypothetical protein